MANIAQTSTEPGGAADIRPRGTAIRRTPLERLEYAIIVSTLLLLVVLAVQPILNLVAMSFSDPSRVAGMISFGRDGLDHERRATALFERSNISMRIVARWPAVSATVARFSVTGWRVQLSMTSWPLIHSLTPSSELV